MGKTAVIALLALVLFMTCGAVIADVAASDATSAPAPAAVAAVVPVPPGYHLQQEDAMRISVWGEPNLATQQVVDPQGFISMPMIGSIHAEGLTQDELVAKISEGLKKYLVEPKVQVEIINFHKAKVYVLGQVNRPGIYEMKPGDRVMESIALAASFTEEADLTKAVLTHKDSDVQIPIDLEKLFHENDMTQNVALADGDTLFIPEDTMNKYFVLGEVMRQGMYKLKKDVTVVDALSNAGGPTDRASLKSTYVLRGDPKNPQRIPVDMDKVLKKGDLAQNVALQPGDVVFISETNKLDWDKVSRVVSAIVNTSYLFRIW